MGRGRRRGRAVLGDSHLTRVAAAGLLCLAAVACGAEQASSCRPPTAEGLRADREKALFVARIVVTGDARLEQGPTRSRGYLVRTESVLAGDQPPAEFALWPALDISDLRKDNKYVLFGRNSFSGDTSPVTANGAPTTAFHVAVPGGVFEVTGGEIARACRGGHSEAVDDDVLSGI